MEQSKWIIDSCVQPDGWLSHQTAEQKEASQLRTFHGGCLNKVQNQAKGIFCDRNHDNDSVWGVRQLGTEGTDKAFRGASDPLNSIYLIADRSVSVHFAQFN